MLNTLEQLNNSLVHITNPAPLPITQPSPPMFANIGAQLDRLTERFSNLETRTARISTDITTNRSQMTLVLATTNSLTAAIEGQRRELTSNRLLQHEVPVQQPLDTMLVEHEDRGLQTEYLELQDRGLQTPYWQVSSRDAATQTSSHSPPQPESTSPVLASPVSQAEPFMGTPINRANALLEGLSPLTTMSSIDTMPTFSVSRASEDPESPQESVVQQEVLLRRSARAAPKVKKV
jgi:hypothetical protein